MWLYVRERKRAKVKVKKNKSKELSKICKRMKE